MAKVAVKSKKAEAPVLKRRVKKDTGKEVVVRKALDAELLPAPTTKDIAIAKKCLDKIVGCWKQASASYYDIAVAVNEAYDKHYAEVCGYPNFESFVEKTIGMGYRTAMYLKDCGEAIKRQNIPRDRVESIGWTKFKELAPALKGTAELSPAKAAVAVDRLLKKGETMSTKALQEDLKKGKERPSVSDERVRLNMAFEAEPGSIVMDALRLAFNELGTEVPSTAIVHICTEWMALKGASGGTLSINDMIAHVERTYGVKIGSVVAAVEAAGKKQKAAKAVEEEPATKQRRKRGVAESVVEPVAEAESEEEVDLEALDKAGMLEFIKQYKLDVPKAAKMKEDALRKELYRLLTPVEGAEVPAEDEDDDIEKQLGLVE